MYENYQMIRNAKGFKDADVARECGISKTTFSDWKNGRSNPKTDKLIAISKFLGCSINDITGEQQEDNYYADEATRNLVEFLHKNPEYHVLFDASRKVKPDDIKKALKAIGLFIEE